MRSIILYLVALVWTVRAAASWVGGDPSSEYCLYFVLVFQALTAAIILERDS